MSGLEAGAAHGPGGWGEGGRRPVSMKALAILHVESEGSGTRGEFLAAGGAEIRYARLYAGDVLPASPEGLDALVSMGGPMNVYEEERYPFLAAETEFLRQAFRFGAAIGLQFHVEADGAMLRQWFAHAPQERDEYLEVFKERSAFIRQQALTLYRNFFSDLL
ncbi:MAG: hypothetical protein NTW86_16220 [Candidatus Sumerlaeota bacterium]|nr:hypothetical protein [Candidatus Sumerlaeota bacterium]